MKIVYSSTEFKAGTILRKIYMYEDDGDVIMTDGPLYEDPRKKPLDDDGV